MKIGEYDVNYTDELKINQILSEFFGFECKVIDGITSGIGISKSAQTISAKQTINYTQVLN